MPVTRKLLPVAVAAALVLPAAQAAEPAAVVNGEPITEEAVSTFRQMLGQQRGQAPREQVVEELVMQRLLAAEARAAGLDEEPDNALRLALQTQRLLASLALRAYLEKNPPSEETIQALYEQVAAASTGTEYKARHILLEQEDQAQAMIAELDYGADFAELAKAHSTGPSGPEGGDLGWFEADTMVPPFAQAVAGMDAGDYTSEPVKTQFGWHVILLEDSREASAPPMAQVRPQLMQQAQSQVLRQYFGELRANAEVEIPAHGDSSAE